MTHPFAKMASLDHSVVLKQGAEARIYETDFFGRSALIKRRFSKKYRHANLDDILCKERTRAEVRALIRCSLAGIQTPSLYFVDISTSSIWLEYEKDSVTVKNFINDIVLKNDDDSTKKMKALAEKIGKTLAKLHSNNIIHGDLTTSNMLLYPPYEKSNIVLIDFGLSYVESCPEDKGVDLYVLEKAFISTHPILKWVLDLLISIYMKEGTNTSDVLKKLKEIRLRGRKRTMVG